MTGPAPCGNCEHYHSYGYDCPACGCSDYNPGSKFGARPRKAARADTPGDPYPDFRCGVCAHLLTQHNIDGACWWCHCER